ncbi:hypothetical protein EST38_g14432 [Candolleomyces aberdarensis]|uniref:Uncharacterized protein n=1 Tax=Candolleomyces aberdarensis TaxID=2316362 RepID=A0A4Q2CXE0_9AGAR|nr:hypothetical protein EST38_g14432 [Candolleomyces aberdarensis]
MQPPPEDRTSIKVAVDPKTDRLQRLQLWTGVPTDLPILMKIEGEYTTDHVPTENRVVGAIGFENDEANNVKNQITSDYDPFHERAAFEPRFLGGPSSVTRTFARIVKKRGVLALSIVDPTDYDEVPLNDKVGIVGLDTFAPGKNLTLVAKHEGSTKD